MIVPEYWAEARLQHRSHRRSITVRRFGWSDDSPAAAQAHADARACEALERVLAGEPLRRREPKVAYNGAEGVPIREEIVQRHGDTVVSRNGYGALCLNTPDVLFADVDFSDEAGGWLRLTVFGVLVAAAIAFGMLTQSHGWGVAAVVVALLFGSVLAHLLHRWSVKMRGGPERIARRRVAAFVAANPDWHLRVYRTPAGLRVLAMHRRFDPASDEAANLFEALGTDPLYARMCRRQHCFRARVSPKPWRIGIGRHLRPRPGVWPVSPERMPERRRWVEDYEQAARGHAACRFVEALGSIRSVDATAERVMVLHDDLCRARQALPIA
ncbi:hypothetical protein [Marilutibacter chinensis]|uniref:Transmembrane protein n=1 Tax=Marilutibacter chinensis TaxID=2912247 RepID=A0ABS9HWE2_9GAMM|nr:hypothetical protein [Lysobacter chinensis]MCF7221216.1 hypothetical protein [Lysobacter chinensis]MCF7223043.1 hypothetical protein [Lysobacter chinensis]